MSELPTHPPPAYPPPPPERRRRRLLPVVVAVVAALLLVGAAVAVPLVRTNVRADDVARPGAVNLDAVQEYDGLKRDHVVGDIDYPQTPPVGGPHAPVWLDCGAYDEPVRDENAVHDLEHGAVWITYDPSKLSKADIATLAKLVENEPGRFMSPYAGLDSPVSVQSWGHQLKVDSAGDPRIKQFADLMTLNNKFTPEPGASCENPDFIAHPRLASEDVAGGAAATTAPATGTTAP